MTLACTIAIDGPCICLSVQCTYAYITGGVRLVRCLLPQRRGALIVLVSVFVCVCLCVCVCVTVCVGVLHVRCSVSL